MSHTTKQYKPFKKLNLCTRYPCPRCGADFAVFPRQFVPDKPAGRFLWWKWPAVAAYWIALCAECSNIYAVDAEPAESR